MQNSLDQLDSDQDQRKSTGMEDSTEMRIEFLRKRLLAERSVSRAARQRADELTKRVLELEKQLNIVSLQRKEAEKATADLLAMLENRGISELSEDFDSSSDQDVIHCESKLSNNLPEEEGSVDSKMRRNPNDDCSSCELESSHLSGRSLSWKSGKDFHCSHEKKKYIDYSCRRRSAFASTASASPRRRVGKSCRQIRHRETRSAVEDTRIDNSMLVSQDNGVAAYSEDFPTQSAIVTESLEENYDKRDAKVLLGGPVSGDSENQRLVVNAHNYLNVHGSDKDMQRALEHQAKLIGQYEEEEKAQREWEEKFRETNNSTPDSCEPGNHSDVTEERDEAKTHSPPYPVETVASHNQEESSKVENAGFAKESSKSQSNGLQSIPNADMGCYQDQKPTNMLTHESPPASDFVFPVAPGKQDQQGAGNYIIPTSHGYHRSTQLEGPAESQSVDSVASHSGSSFCKGDTSGGKNELSAIMRHETPNKLGSVLGALHQAKLSITQKLNGSAIDGGSVQKAIEFPVADRPEVPLGCAGLFRVPSDFLEGTAKANILGSNSRLSLTNYHPDAGRALTALDPFTKYYPDAGRAPTAAVDPFTNYFPDAGHALTAAVDPFTNYFPDAGHALTAVDPFITRHHTESSSSVSNGDRHLAFLTSTHEESRPKIPCWEPLESRSRFPSHKPLFGLSFDMGVPSPSRYAYNNPNTDRSVALSSAYTSTGIPSPSRYAYNNPNTDRSVALSSAYTSTSSSYPDVIPFSSRYAYNTPNMDRSVALPSAYTSTSSSYPDAIPSSSRYAYNSPNIDGSVALPSAHTSTTPFYPETASQLPPDRGTRLFSGSRAGMPPENNFSFYDNHIRPNTYR